jgi:hypothetical protein
MPPQETKAQEAGYPPVKAGRYLCKVVAATMILSGPFAVGIFRLTPVTIPVLLIGIAVLVYSLRRNFGESTTQKVILPLLSVCLTVTLFDLVSRAFLPKTIWVRANAMFEHRWPPLPLVERYTPNVDYQGRMYGDLAGISGVRADREERVETFITDAYGFRNVVSYSAQSPPLELVVLGDSFADGANTTQEQTLPGVFARQFRYQTRNLSMGGAGPWQEFINLAIEIDRAPVSPEGAVLLWLIFTGNDLDDPCYSILEPEQLPWNGMFRSFLVSYGTFRERSPVRLLRLKAEFAIRGMLGSNANHTQVLLRREFLNHKSILFDSVLAERRSRKRQDILQHPNWPCFRSTFSAMKELASAKHLSVALISVPSKEEVYSWVLDNGPPWSTPPDRSPFSMALENISKEEGFTFLDLKPSLVGASKSAWDTSGALLWWRDDVHWNGRGQKEAASVIESKLLHRLLPAR